MNVVTFPTVNNITKNNGQLREEFFNFFSMNTQEQQLYFSQDGHLVPTRTNDELTTLSTEQYTARLAYNSDTNNFMGNTNGVYENFTQSLFLNRSSLLSRTFLNKKIEHFWDEENNLYTNVNGSLFQNVMLPVNHLIKLSTDGTNLFINIDGNNFKFNLTPI